MPNPAPIDQIADALDVSDAELISALEEVIDLDPPTKANLYLGRILEEKEGEERVQSKQGRL